MTNEELNNLPNNIKQIGDIPNNNRIYLEDFAYTYLEQYSKSQDGKEKIALLVGRNMSINDENILFIHGVIQGKYTLQKNGMTELTEKSWQYAEKQLSLYFEGSQIVGWAYVQPGFEDYISEKICAFQKNNLTRGLQVLYIIDPIEKINGFYKWNNNEEVFGAIKGYIIYYEKNDGMQEYMIENKIKEDKQDIIEVDKEENKEIKKEEKEEKIDAGIRARAITMKKVPKHYPKTDPGKTVNLLSSVSFVMLMVCFLMGAGLIQNDDKIKELQIQLTALQEEFQHSQAVFAAYTQSTQTTERETETTTKENQTKKTSYSKYKISTGDTLISICREKYGDLTKINEIRKINNIKDDKIVAGRTILLP